MSMLWSSSFPRLWRHSVSICGFIVAARRGVRLAWWPAQCGQTDKHETRATECDRLRSTMQPVPTQPLRGGPRGYQPRNHPAALEARLIEAEIATILGSRSQLEPLLTAKDIRPKLSRPLSERQIQAHIKQIRARQGR